MSTTGSWLFLFALIQAIGSLFSILTFYGITPRPLRPNDGVLAVTSSPRRISLILMVMLLLGSIVFSSIGWYRLEHRSDRESMEFVSPEITQRISGRVYRNQEVHLDGVEYSSCTFENVTFVYRGTGPTVLLNNKILGTISLRPGSAPVTGTVLVLAGLRLLRSDVPLLNEK